MLRRIPVIAACVAALAFSALPAAAATSPIHSFGIPGVYGIRAWGAYYDTGTRVRVTVCVRVAARSVYGAVAVALAFDSGYRRHDNVSAVTIGDGHTQCRVMVTRYANHLVVEALSGYKNGTVRQRGKLKRIY